MICDFLGMDNYATLEHWRGGELLRSERFKNGVTNVGKNAFLDAFFNSGAQPANWYLGLISNTGFTSVSSSDTAASHPLWTEWTDTGDAGRLDWGQGPPPASRSRAGASSPDHADRGRHAARDLPQQRRDQGRNHRHPLGDRAVLLSARCGNRRYTSFDLRRAALKSCRFLPQQDLITEVPILQNLGLAVSRRLPGVITTNVPIFQTVTGVLVPDPKRLSMSQSVAVGQTISISKIKQVTSAVAVAQTTEPDDRAGSEPDERGHDSANPDCVSRQGRLRQLRWGLRGSRGRGLRGGADRCQPRSP
jgi:hypothetical protein